MKNYADRAWIPIAMKGGEPWLEESELVAPLGWENPMRIVAKCVHPIEDLFREDVPNEMIDRVFAIMALCPQHTFLVLTKQPSRMREYIGSGRIDKIFVIAQQQVRGFSSLMWPLPNVWLGVTVGTQDTADKRIPPLLRASAAKRLVLVEPLLGEINLQELGDEKYVSVVSGKSSPLMRYDALLGHDHCGLCAHGDGPKLDWVIVGGESGLGAQPMSPDWVRSLRDQCVSTYVPFFFNGWGEWHPRTEDDQNTTNYDTMRHAGKHAGRELDGREWNEVPK